MAKKIDVESSVFGENHLYLCFACGFSSKNSNNFYKSPYSSSFIKNDRVVPLCKKCVSSQYESYEKKFGARKACILMCYKLDIPFYYTLFDSILASNNNFSMGYYIRVINGKQYLNQDFSQTILTGELQKNDKDIVQEKEEKWTAEEIRNKEQTLEVVGYDPFEGQPNNDRRFMFNELVKYFDEDIADDTYKLSQIIQIVNNNNQIRKYDLFISTLNPVNESDFIKKINDTKKDLVFSNDKIAKENEISVKNRSNKEVGKSTLTHLLKSLRELDFEKAEVNYYDQLKSEGTLWGINMSMKAIQENAMFDENDKQEIFEKQRSLVQELQSALDDALEETRLLKKENNDLKEKLRDASNE